MVDPWVDSLRALAAPLRLRILALLTREELAVGELAEVLMISQPRVSHHLRTLRASGFVRVRREGSWTFCSLEASRRDGPGAELLELLERRLRAECEAVGDLERLERVLDARRQRARVFFEAAADSWDHLEPLFEGSGLRHQSLSMLLPGDLVLADVGCGTGFVARELARRARRVILVDHSAAMLERARAALGGNLPAQLDFRVGDMDRLPLADGEVDGAFANLVLHHVPDLTKALAELARVIRAGGTLVVSDMLPHQEEWLREEHADLRLGLEPDKLAALAVRVGFSETMTEPAVDRLRARASSGREALVQLFVLRARKPGGRQAQP